MMQPKNLLSCSTHAHAGSLSRQAVDSCAMPMHAHSHVAQAHSKADLALAQSGVRMVPDWLLGGWIRVPINAWRHVSRRVPRAADALWNGRKTRELRWNVPMIVRRRWLPSLALPLTQRDAHRHGLDECIARRLRRCCPLRWIHQHHLPRRWLFASSGLLVVGDQQ